MGPLESVMGGHTLVRLVRLLVERDGVEATSNIFQKLFDTHDPLHDEDLTLVTLTPTGAIEAIIMADLYGRYRFGPRGEFRAALYGNRCRDLQKGRERLKGYIEKTLDDL